MKDVLGSLPEVITAYKNYNLLVPTATDVQLNPFYKFHVEEVPVDLGENSGDIFKVGSVKTGKQDERGKDIWEDVFSFADLPEYSICRRGHFYFFRNRTFQLKR